MDEINDLLKGANRARRITIHVPHDDEWDWMTDVTFEGKEPFTLRFISQSRYIHVYDLAMGFDLIRVTDLNAEGAQLEYGRYQVEISVDDETSKFLVNSIEVL